MSSLRPWICVLALVGTQCSANPTPKSIPENAGIVLARGDGAPYDLSAELARCEAHRAFTPEAAKAAWERCRELASRSSATPTPPTRLTVQVATRT